MKHLNRFILTALCSLLLMQSNAQDSRFLTEVFDEVQVTSGLTYGVNETILLLPLVGQAVPESLIFDFYEPVGDSISERPLVLLFHTGNFLPIQVNQTVLGTRSDSSNVEIATRLAKMGYVVASVDYRLGWNPTAPTQPERALGLIQAAYRGIQDARTAIRFFKRDYAENENSFGVDTSRITLWGIGTGGYITLPTAYLHETLEIINASNPPAKFLLDLDMDQVFETSMVDVPSIGNLTGETVGVIDADGEPSLPFAQPGDTLNRPNHVGYSSEFQLVVNMAGALGDLSWMDNSDPRDNVPVIAYHLPTDAFAPYEDDVLIVPTTGDRIVQVQGSKRVVETANEQGINQVFIDANIDDEITQRARAASEEAGHEYFEGLFPFIRPLNPLGRGEGDPWQWWDSELWSQVVFDSVNNVSFEEASRANNFDAGPEKGRRYIDSIFMYFAPRAFAALDLDIVLSTPTLSAPQVGLSVAPNPGQQFVNFQTDNAYPIEDIQVFDLQGRVVRSYSNVNQNTFTLNREALADGIYIAKLRFKEGILSQKLIFN